MNHIKCEPQPTPIATNEECTLSESDSLSSYASGSEDEARSQKYLRILSLISDDEDSNVKDKKRRKRSDDSYSDSSSGASDDESYPLKPSPSHFHGDLTVGRLSRRALSTPDSPPLDISNRGIMRVYKRRLPSKPPSSSLTSTPKALDEPPRATTDRYIFNGEAQRVSIKKEVMSSNDEEADENSDPMNGFVTKKIKIEKCDETPDDACVPGANSQSATVNKSFNIICGKITGLFDPSMYFHPTGKCIFREGDWSTPSEFEKLAGKGACKKWRLSIRHLESGLPLEVLQEAGKVFFPHRGRSGKTSKTPVHSVRAADFGKDKTLDFSGNFTKTIGDKVKERNRICNTSSKKLVSECFVSPDVYLPTNHLELITEIAKWKKNCMGEKLRIIAKAKELRNAQKILNKTGPRRNLKLSVTVKRYKNADSEVLEKALKSSEKNFKHRDVPTTIKNHNDKLKLVNLQHRVYNARKKDKRDERFSRPSSTFNYNCHECQSYYSNQTELSSHLILFHASTSLPTIPQLANIHKRRQQSRPSTADASASQTNISNDDSTINKSTCNESPQDYIPVSSKSLQKILTSIDQFRVNFDEIKEALKTIHDEVHRTRTACENLLQFGNK